MTFIEPYRVILKIKYTLKKILSSSEAFMTLLYGEKKHFKKDFFSSSSIIITGDSNYKRKW